MELSFCSLVEPPSLRFYCRARLQASHKSAQWPRLRSNNLLRRTSVRARSFRQIIRYVPGAIDAIGGGEIADFDIAHRQRSVCFSSYNDITQRFQIASTQSCARLIYDVTLRPAEQLLTRKSRHFRRVIGYARTSDYLVGLAAAAFAPGALLALERFAPSHVGKGGFPKAMRLAGAVGVVGGFLYFYQRSSRTLSYIGLPLCYILYGKGNNDL